jgi:hypothetical protein
MLYIHDFGLSTLFLPGIRQTIAARKTIERKRKSALAIEKMMAARS